MPITTSPNMNLPVPIVGQELGPQWATDINNSLSIIDAHTHSAGSGVQINPAGLNINSDLTFSDNNATQLRSSRYQPQSALLSLPADIGAVYVSGVDLYFNDVNGTQIRLTQSGSIVGTAGSITGLVPPASVTYSSISETFVFQSDVVTPANLDAASVTIRDLVASSHGVTLEAPVALGSDYSLVLPTLPGALSLMTLDAAGNMGTVTPDNSTIQFNSGTLRVVPGGITTTQIAAATILGSNIAAATITSSNIAAATITGSNIAATTVGPTNLTTFNFSGPSASSGGFSTASASSVPVPALSLTINCSGVRPILAIIQSAAAAGGQIYATTGSGAIEFRFNGSVVSSDHVPISAAGQAGALYAAAYSFIIVPPLTAGVNTISVNAYNLGAGTTFVTACQLFVYEL